MRQIVAKPLTPEAWAPFGWVPLPDTDPRDGAETLEFAWGDVHVNRIGHRRDEVETTDRGLLCERLFRHATHTQVLLPLDVDCVVVVAPPGADMGSPADAESLAAFLLEPLSSVVLHRGTWHWGPFPTEADAVELFNVQGLRYVEDNESVDLAALGAPIEVRLA